MNIDYERPRYHPLEVKSMKVFNSDERKSRSSESSKLHRLEIWIMNQIKNNSLFDSSEIAIELAKEYAKLVVLPKRKEEEEDRIDEILELANHSDILSFWIIEVDHLVGHSLGLLDEDDRESYKDQQALLQEYAGSDEISSRPHSVDYKEKNLPSIQVRKILDDVADIFSMD
jgi:hypothetical protein